MQDELTRAFEAALPADTVFSGDAIEARYGHDWSGLAPVPPRLLLRPRTTQDVAIALRLCNELAVALVPQGGRTGLAGGAHPVPGCVALSMERMQGVEEIDVVMGTATVLAGTPLAEVQAAAEARGLYFPLDLGARGSCTIGGNLSTNAGGNRVIRYGMAREHVLGLEYVLPDGTVVSALNKMIKNNAGYDLKHLLIGSEGTLGIITRAVLRLQARPLSVASALCGCADFDAVIALLQAARAALGPSLSAFEVMWPGFVDTMTAGLPHLRKPFAQPHGVYVLIEASGFQAGAEAEHLENCLAPLLESRVLTDAVVAASERDAQDLWAVRESVSEYSRVLGPIIGFDIGLPTSIMGEAVGRVQGEVTAAFADARVLCYGHIGDSNLHVVVNIPSRGAEQPHAEVDAIVYGLVQKLGGTVSAEHGIGLLKKTFLGYTRSAEEIALMRSIKGLLDPRNILNPGKVF
ncbi:MAG: FAD-binding oxidoreductase [Burkholderiaceae bacterium]